MNEILTPSSVQIREEVRANYALAARSVGQGSACCGETAEGSCCGPTQVFGPSLYDALDQENVPNDAVLASLGCGNPTAVAELKPGEVVLDLGSGGGLDVLLSAARVGPAGKAYGLDMTDEMLELARANQLAAGTKNVEFLKGYLEEIPLPEASVDVIISNCVINLAADKTIVFSEMRRVLRAGGRLGISDVVASDDLSEKDRSDRGSFVGCIAGALSFTEYKSGLAKAGFDSIEVSPTHQVSDGMFSAIIKARRV